MRKDVEAQQARGQRSVLFADANPPLFAPAEAAAGLGQLRAALSALGQFSEQQLSGVGLSSGSTASKITLLKSLESGQRALRRTFDQVKKKDSSITASVNLPVDDKEGSLIAAVMATIATVEPLKAKFIARGKKADFLDKFETDLALYQQLVSGQQSGTADRQSAVAQIEAAVASLVEAIEDLDDIMENTLDEPGEAMLLGEWKRASKLGTIIRNPGNATAKVKATP